MVHRQALDVNSMYITWKDKIPSPEDNKAQKQSMYKELRVTTPFKIKGWFINVIVKLTNFYLSALYFEKYKKLILLKSFIENKNQLFILNCRLLKAHWSP